VGAQPHAGAGRVPAEFLRDEHGSFDAFGHGVHELRRQENRASATGMFDGMQYIGGAAVGIGMGWVLEHFGWGTWGPSMIGFSLVGSVLMLQLWDAVPNGKGGHYLSGKSVKICGIRDLFQSSMIAGRHGLDRLSRF
jgi:hypothetical protein